MNASIPQRLSSTFSSAPPTKITVDPHLHKLLMSKLAESKAADTPNMRVTRARSGKLPTPTPRAGFINDFEEDDASPPTSPSRNKRSSKVAQKPAEVSKEVVEAVPAEVDPIKEEEPAPIFISFKSEIKIPAGLGVIRPVTGGYEFVALKDIDFERVSSEATGALLKGDKGRLDMLSIAEKDFEHAKFACGQAIHSAEKEIFRINKLPLELRLIIYEMAMISDKPLRHTPGSTAPSLALNLMLTSKVMLEETRPIFYKNSFQIPLSKNVEPESLAAIRDHLKEVTFVWQHYTRLQSGIFKFLATCPNFKILTLKVSDWCYHRTKYSNQMSSSAVKKFLWCPGYDRIIAIRGLEKVRVEKLGSSVAYLTDAEVQALQDHLTPILTKPKYIPPPKPVNVVKPTKAKKGKKAKKSQKHWENDSDFDSESVLLRNAFTHASGGVAFDLLGVGAGLGRFASLICISSARARS
ncbi:hypothetical protein VTL71DRAFT_3158 [Oculimacula yallundae]|uniref:Uncharacterized protein n=1 Tax=Oculimacula yallundae TaxID=86028 RepID=A0ABR4C6D1_9HELO